MFPHGVSLECPQEVGAAAVRAALQGCFPAPCLDESFVLAPRLDEAFTRLLELPARLPARLLPPALPLDDSRLSETLLWLSERMSPRRKLDFILI